MKVRGFYKDAPINRHLNKGPREIFTTHLQKQPVEKSIKILDGNELQIFTGFESSSPLQLRSDTFDKGTKRINRIYQRYRISLFWQKSAIN